MSWAIAKIYSGVDSAGFVNCMKHRMEENLQKGLGYVVPVHDSLGNLAYWVRQVWLTEENGEKCVMASMSTTKECPPLEPRPFDTQQDIPDNAGPHPLIVDKKPGPPLDVGGMDSIFPLPVYHHGFHLDLKHIEESKALDVQYANARIQKDIEDYHKMVAEDSECEDAALAIAKAFQECQLDFFYAALAGPVEAYDTALLRLIAWDEWFDKEGLPREPV